MQYSLSNTITLDTKRTTESLVSTGSVASSHLTKKPQANSDSKFTTNPETTDSGNTTERLSSTTVNSIMPTSTKVANMPVTSFHLTTKPQANSDFNITKNPETNDSKNVTDKLLNITVNFRMSTSKEPFNESVTTSPLITNSQTSTDSVISTNPDITDFINTTNKQTRTILYTTISTSSESNTGTFASIEDTTDRLINSKISTTTVTSSVTSAEKQANFSRIGETSTNIVATTQTPTNNDTTDNFTLVYNTTPKQCACNCMTNSVKYITTNSTNYLPSELQKQLLVNKKTLTSYTMTKNSLDNVEDSSKYYGSTIGLLIIILFFGFLFLSDLTSLCGKKSPKN
jgi:hypothetical protein